MNVVAYSGRENKDLESTITVCKELEFRRKANRKSNMIAPIQKTWILILTLILRRILIVIQVTINSLGQKRQRRAKELARKLMRIYRQNQKCLIKLARL
jgi:hypothetical protein